MSIAVLPPGPDPPLPLLSVHGDARLMVAPDFATLACAISSTEQSKAEALGVVAAALERLTADLSEMGGAAFTVETERHPLTWSAHGLTTQPVYVHDKETHRSEQTGQVTATASVEITLRAVDLLDALGAALGRQELLSTHQVSWHVDWDNPAWPQVRAAAIRAAISTARDYAAALGGRLKDVVHIADAGLLGGDSGRLGFGVRHAALSGGHGGESDTPALDPVPQELAAVIEARFTAIGISVAAPG